MHLGRTATFLISFSHFQADRLMFAIHLVHGMHPEMFEAKVIILLCVFILLLLFCFFAIIKAFCIVFLFARICMAQRNRTFPLMLSAVD